MNKITFERAGPKHHDTIFSWLEKPHIKEFWDNSQEHKDDILNFIYGRRQSYFYGTTKYWVGLIDGDPYCFILSDIVQSDQDISDIHRKYLSINGHTITIDFGIGNNNFLGKGLAAPTLKAFVEFYHIAVDPAADTFFIDPDEHNPRAKHVYEKAGFIQVGDYDVHDGAFKGGICCLMVKKYKKTAILDIIASNEVEKVHIRDRIVNYNRSQVPFTQSEDFIPLNYHVCNDEGDIIAGVIAMMYHWKIIFVDVLFVDEAHRNKGLGTALLEHIETVARSNGASLIHLDSFDWQAKDFYLKHGYEIFGVLDDCPPGHKRYYLKKNIAGHL